MSITIEIAEAKLREVEEALDIHDPSQLVLALIEEKLARRRGFERTGRVWTSENFDRTLAAAAKLPDLTDEDFAAFQRELNRPPPPAWSSHE